MDATSLNLIQKVNTGGSVQDILQHSGQLVVGGLYQVDGQFEGIVVVLDADWESEHDKVTTYQGEETRKLKPFYLTVNDKDIFVSDCNDKVVIQYNQALETQRVWRTERAPRGIAVYGDMLHVLVAGQPDAVVAYKTKGTLTKEVMKLIENEKKSFGVIMSLAIQDNKMAVLCTNGLMLYDLIAHQ